MTSSLKLQSENIRKKASNVKSVGLFKLYRYAETFDSLLIIVGSALAILHGVSLRFLGLIFGRMTNVVLLDYETFNNSSNSSFTIPSDVIEDDSPYDGPEIAKNLLQFSIYYSYVGAIVLVTSFAQAYCWDLSCERQTYKLRLQFLKQILRQDIAWFDSQQSENLTTRLLDDLERVRDGIGSKMSMVIQQSSGFVAGLVVGLITNVKLTLFIICISPIVIGCAALSAKVVSSSASRELQKYAEAGCIADEVLNNIRTVVAFGGERREIERYRAGLSKGWREAITTYYYIGIIFAAYFFLIYGSYGAVVWLGAKLVSKGEADPGAVFTVLLSAMGGALQLGSSLPFLNAVSSAIGSSATLFSVIDRIPGIDSYGEDGKKLAVVKGHIRFSGVTFYYPNRPTVPILRKLSLDITPGQTIAIVGPSGAGKSTIASLLLRFYDPDEGEVLLDGYNLKELNVRWFRSRIGLVSQEPVLFSSSILQNIQYGRADVTREQVVSAAKMANAHDFIQELPLKYDTPVGERGTQLSGGQKQRIAIARAIVRDPLILVLDEATSALDGQSEAEVQRALENAMRGRTTIIIAHRLSTIKSAQVIYALKNGTVHEWGSHEKLMTEKGLYYSLVTAQLTETKEEETGDLEQPLAVKSPKKHLYHSDTDTIVLPQTIIPEAIPIVTFRKLFIANLPEWPFLIASVFACISFGCILPIFAYLYGQIFSTFQLLGEALLMKATFWAVMFLLLGVVAGFSQCAMIASLVNAAERLIFRLRYTAFENILRQDVGWFDRDENSPGKLTTKLSRDAPLIKQMSGLRIGQIFAALATLALAIALIVIQGWQLAILLVIAGPIVATASYQEMRLVRKNLKRDSDLMVEAGRIATEAVYNVKTVQALGKEEKVLESYLQYLEEPYREAQMQALRHAVVFALSQSVTCFLYSAVFGYGSYLIKGSVLVPSQVYKTFFIIAYSASSIGQFAIYTQDFARAKLSAGLIFQLIESKTDIDAFTDDGAKPIIKGRVSFENVHFRYPARPEVEVLRGATLNIEAGQKVALVGSSGGGKSTFLALLERFYNPLSGRVCVDGKNVKEINLAHLRKNIGLVTQEPVLFSCSIAENIAYGEDVIDMEAVIRAANIANIHTFIVSLPQGYDTKIGGREAQLSGGQKQRIAIARALLRNPKILILDEATSALDPESEQIVQEALEKAQRGRTCIMIAHRLSTVKNVNKIAVLHKGVVAEEGCHRELMSKGGLYYNLVKKQQGK